MPSKKLKSSRSEKLIQEMYPEFSDRVHKRLNSGARSYGDSSLNRELESLLNEVLEEIEDQCGWSFLAWLKVKDLLEKVKREF